MHMDDAPTTWFVIPCAAEKVDRATTAAELYTSHQFRYTLRKVLTEAAATERAGLGPVRVLILSAAHGLLELDDVVGPYDLKMGERGSVTAEAVANQADALGITFGHQVYAFLPAVYRDVLTAAMWSLDVATQDVYEAAPGIGYQRGVLASLERLP
jgi:hypothetical protein